jgi:hypothetical protein
MQTSETVSKLYEALSMAQGEIEDAKKDTENKFFNSKYADLASVWDACRLPLSKNGLCVMQAPFNTEIGEVGVTTILAHKSGEWSRSDIKLKVTTNDPQKIGSLISYLRRYSLMAMIGVAQKDDDDDGNKASHDTPPDWFPDVPPKKASPPPVILPPLPNSKPPAPKKPASATTDEKTKLLSIVWEKLRKELGKTEEEAQELLIKFTGKKSTQEMTLSDLKKAQGEVDNLIELKSVQDVPLGI